MDRKTGKGRVAHHIYESATSLARALREGQVSSREALEHHLARVERFDPQIHAVVALDAEGARKRADAADRVFAAGTKLGPLHGLPMTVKDSFEFAGLPTVCGEPSLTGHRPEAHAVAVQRLIDAGAVIFGKTNTPQLAQDVQTYNPVFGTTCNPWDRTRTCGGSSGGAAAAVAAGLTPLELGSDLAGSVRTPAHYCGVYGHKSSHRLIPLQGHIPGPPGTLSEPDLAVAGPIGRTAGDLALALSVLAGPGDLDAPAWRLTLPEARAHRLEDFRVACWPEDGWAPLDEATRGTLAAVVQTLRAAGVSVEEHPALPCSIESCYAHYETLLSAVIVAAGLPKNIDRQLRLLAPWARLLRRDRPRSLARFAVGTTQSYRDWARAHEARERLRRSWHEFFLHYDILLMPVTPTPAPPHNQKRNIYQRKIRVNGHERPYVDQFAWVAPATLAGLPATAAPAGRNAEGLPIAIQIVSDYLQDATTIEFAGLLGEHIGGFRSPPGFEQEST